MFLTKQQITDYNDANKYIILQNDSLHVMNKTLTCTINEVQSDLVEKESEIESQETSIRYMKGEMKNFVELREMEKRITEITIAKYNAMVKLRDMNHMMTRYYAILGGATIVAWAGLEYCRVHIGITIPTCAILFGGSAWVLDIGPLIYNSAVNQVWGEIARCDTDICQRKIEIKRVDDSNDFISTYIDNM